MAEIKTAAPAGRSKLPLIILCLLLLGAIVLAFVMYGGKTEAVKQNAELQAQLDEMTTSVKKLEE